MKIAHVVCRYPPYYGGMGNVVLSLASELDKRGHEVTVFTPDYLEAKEVRVSGEQAAAEHAEALDATIDYARRLKPRLYYGNAASLPQLAKELKTFDLVHLHYPFFGTANIVRRWKKREANKPLVITYHMDARGTGWKGLFFKYYSDWWQPKILSAADLVTISSFDYAAACSARNIFFSQRKKWLELPFGVDLERFRPGLKSGELLRKLKLEADKPIILFVGSMDEAHYFKGVPVLLRALRNFSQGEVQALFVGEGGLRSGFEELSRVYGVRDMVRFVGEVTDDDLPHYYRLADLCVLPSIHQGEAFGMVLLESFASGVPVVATDIAGVRTVAGAAGWLVPPHDQAALFTAIKNFFAGSASDRLAWRSRARAVAEKKYAWAPIAARLDQAYQQLASGKGD